jgi:Domain of unknown function (DUF4157)
MRARALTAREPAAAAAPVPAARAAAPARAAVPPRSAGRPLDRATRALAESLFGHQFSQVRVHTGAAAAVSARALGARAYTIGRDIVVARRELAPGSTGERSGDIAAAATRSASRSAWSPDRPTTSFA